MAVERITAKLKAYFRSAPEGEVARWVAGLPASQSTVSRYSTGKGVPPITRASGIARLTGWPLEEVKASINESNLHPTSENHDHPDLQEQIDEIRDLIAALDLVSLRERLDASTEEASLARETTRKVHRTRQRRAQQIQGEEEERRSGSGSTDAESQ